MRRPHPVTPSWSVKINPYMRRTLLLLVVFFAFQVAIGSLGVVAGIPNLWVLLLTNVLLLIFMLLWCRFLPRQLQGEWNRPVRSTIWIAVVATFLILLCEVNVLLEMLNIPDWLPQETMEQWYSDPLFIITAVLIAPIAEELVFRKGMIDALQHSRYARVRGLAVLISALLFGAIHLNPIQSLGAFAFGLFFGWVYVRTRSLLLPILCHILNNGLTVATANIWGADASITDVIESHYKVWVLVIMGAAVLLVALVKLADLFAQLRGAE